MQRWIFDSFVRFGLLALAVAVTAAAPGCAGETTSPPSSASTSSAGGSGGEGGAGGAAGAGGSGAGSACDQDCTLIETPQCLISVCNEGQYPGRLGACTVVPEDGVTCDDNLFCTTDDTCSDGQCVGGPPNDCGLAAETCEEVTCDEDIDMCAVAPVDDGLPCQPEDLCQNTGACTNGLCIGPPKDCFFSPFNECNLTACNPDNGLCEPTAPDPTKNGQPCILTGDKCAVGKTCSDGQCLGGGPKDCSQLTTGCTNGVCDPATGNCMAEAIPPGGMCLEATDPCNTGICDVSGACLPMPNADGTPCNDYDSCTGGDLCTAGACAGSPIGACDIFFEANFEGGCPGGWTLTGDWECGTPTGVGPGAAYEGAACIATQIDGAYNPNQTYAGTTATSPPINLSGATSPRMRFRMWHNTEGSTYDGANLKVSTDGTTFTQVLSVTPAYNVTVATEQAWGGDQSALGWQLVEADLAAYVGQTIYLRFAFRSDGSVERPGVYIDDILVANANVIPLEITTTSPLPDALVTNPYTVQLQKTGGTAGAVWSITGGTNHAWLSVDPATGILSGTPSAANSGPFSVTVRVQEPSLPSNFDEKIFTGEVVAALFTQSFEGACPNGWTLTGDWECGTPTNVGPSAAFDGVQCIGTQIDANYNNSQSYATTTATSPAIDLAGTTNPHVTFRMWNHTEGLTYDGANLKVSTNGTTFTQIMNVTPAYNVTVSNEQAWGGNQSALGWQLVDADLTPYAGQMVYLRFAFQSDGSIVLPGVYIDQVAITD